MTIVCATNGNLPGIRPCTELGAHRVTCPDHEANGDGPGLCRGCLPLAADVGFLCSHCYSLVEHAYAGWARWRALADASEGRAVSPTGAGGRSVTLGHANITLMFQDIDACERLLASRGDRTLLLWVNDADGAADAIQFAHAALNAYRTHELEERERKTPPPARCPHCGLLTLTRNTERQVGAFTVIECQHCGEQIDKVRTGPASWAGSPACEDSDDGTTHLACDDVDCACWCHHYGPKSRRSGIAALWDADAATAAPGASPRDEWIITDPHTIRRTADERRRTA